MISFRDVSFRYPDSERSALSSLTLTLPDRGFVAIMGANGSGKSTAALCTNALQVPSVGEVSIDGVSTRDPSHHPAIRKCVGVVFQNPHYQFTSLTVERELAFGLENLGIGRSEMEDRVREIISVFELGEFRSVPPYSLSGGQQQRVALAAVMILGPKYLILDEVTSFLAPSSRRGIFRILCSEERMTRTSLVLITQFPDEAMQADRLVIMHDGSVLMDGNPEEIFGRRSELRVLGVPTPVWEN